MLKSDVSLDLLGLVAVLVSRPKVVEALNIVDCRLSPVVLKLTELILSTFDIVNCSDITALLAMLPEDLTVVVLRLTIVLVEEDVAGAFEVAEFTESVEENDETPDELIEAISSNDVLSSTVLDMTVVVYAVVPVYRPPDEITLIEISEFTGVWDIADIRDESVDMGELGGFADEYDIREVVSLDVDSMSDVLTKVLALEELMSSELGRLEVEAEEIENSIMLV